jgi:hypothetical protein
MDTLEIVLKTAEDLAKEYSNWDGDVFDFVSASVAVSDRLSSTDLRDLHRDFSGSSFTTENTEVFFYYSKRRPTIQVIRKEV